MPNIDSSGLSVSPVIKWNFALNPLVMSSHLFSLLYNRHSLGLVPVVESHGKIILIATGATCSAVVLISKYCLTLYRRGGFGPLLDFVTVVEPLLRTSLKVTITSSVGKTVTFFPLFVSVLMSPILLPRIQ